MCNLTFGGEGLKPTKYVKNKISNTMKEKGISKGKNNPMYGTHHTKETKLKISCALRTPNSKFQEVIKSEKYRKNVSKSVSGKKNGMYGKCHSEEVKQKMRNAKIGKKLSEETKKKIGLCRLGKKHSVETIKKMSNLRKLYWKNKSSINVREEK